MFFVRFIILSFLFGNTEHYLYFQVIIEPGNNEGFDATLQARQFLLRVSMFTDLKEQGQGFFAYIFLRLFEKSKIYA